VAQLKAQVFRSTGGPPPMGRLGRRARSSADQLTATTPSADQLTAAACRAGQLTAVAQPRRRQLLVGRRLLRLADHDAIDPLEIVQIRELDNDPPALASHVHCHPGVQVIAEQLLEIEHAGRPKPVRL
jgi:hypothetical protein